MSAHLRPGGVTQPNPQAQLGSPGRPPWHVVRLLCGSPTPPGDCSALQNSELPLPPAILAPSPQVHLQVPRHEGLTQVRVTDLEGNWDGVLPSVQPQRDGGEEEGETLVGFLEAEAPQLNVEEEGLGKERV